MEIETRTVEAAQVWALRQEVLRPGRPIEQAIFDGDDDPRTLHLAAFDGVDIIGVASLFRRALPSEEAEAWQLRGMAIAPKHQNQGIGRALIEACVRHAAQSECSLLWCNARSEAAGFYSKAGFEIRSEEFEIPDVGPHFIMARRIGDHPLRLVACGCTRHDSNVRSSAAARPTSTAATVHPRAL